MKIHLNIDQIVLHGFNIENAPYVGKIIQSELTMLLKTTNVKQLKSHSRDLVSLGSIVIPSDQNNPKLLGKIIAKSIYSSLGNNIQ